MKYLSNVIITADRKNSRSYGKPETVEYDFAVVEGNWITTFDSIGGKRCRKNTTAKHFHGYDGTEITERTFKMRTKKNKLKLEAYNESVKLESERIKEAEADLLDRAKFSRSKNGKRNARHALKVKYNVTELGRAALQNLNIWL